MNILGSGMMAIFGLLYFLILGISIYCFVLFIKLAHRGIKALDIYIDKHNKNGSV